MRTVDLNIGTTKHKLKWLVRVGRFPGVLGAGQAQEEATTNLATLVLHH
jgi:hypothetical protein